MTTSHRATAAERTVSPKVVASTIGAVVAPIALAAVATIVGAIVGQPELLEGAPPLLRLVILATLSAVGSAVAGYRSRDPLRDLGATQLPTTPEPEDA